MIPIDQCENRRLYRIHARNFTLGVYDSEQRAFVGIRTKWGRRYLDREFHWDCGPPFGTARPMEALPVVLPAGTSTECSWPEPNTALFQWMEDAERNYPKP